MMSDDKKPTSLFFNLLHIDSKHNRQRVKIECQQYTEENGHYKIRMPASVICGDEDNDSISEHVYFASKHDYDIYKKTENPRLFVECNLLSDDKDLVFTLASLKNQASHLNEMLFHLKNVPEPNVNVEDDGSVVWLEKAYINLLNAKGVPREVCKDVTILQKGPFAGRKSVTIDRSKKRYTVLLDDQYELWKNENGYDALICNLKVVTVPEQHQGDQKNYAELELHSTISSVEMSEEDDQIEIVPMQGASKTRAAAKKDIKATAASEHASAEDTVASEHPVAASDKATASEHPCTQVDDPTEIVLPTQNQASEQAREQVPAAASSSSSLTPICPLMHAESFSPVSTPAPSGAEPPALQVPFPAQGQPSIYSLLEEDTYELVRDLEVMNLLREMKRHEGFILESDDVRIESVSVDIEEEEFIRLQEKMQREVAERCDKLEDSLLFLKSAERCIEQLRNDKACDAKDEHLHSFANSVNSMLATNQEKKKRVRSEVPVTCSLDKLRSAKKFKQDVENEKKAILSQIETVGQELDRIKNTERVRQKMQLMETTLSS